MPDSGCELVTEMDHGLYDGTLLRVFDDPFQSISLRSALTSEFTPFHQLAQERS